jgi:NADPH:quinone reductase-like Zn-dependent oxidoreductase
VQLAKLCGFTVHTTDSPKNFALVRGFGADHVYDCKDPEAPTKIKEATSGTLKLAVNTISEHGSGKFIAGAFADESGKTACTIPQAAPRKNIETISSLGYDLIVDVHCRAL